MMGVGFRVFCFRDFGLGFGVRGFLVSASSGRIRVCAVVHLSDHVSGTATLWALKTGKRHVSHCRDGLR